MIRPDRRRPGIQGYSTPLDQQHTTSERTDAYFGTVLRGAPSGTRLARAQALKTYFEFVELKILAEPPWAERLTDTDRRALSPLFWSHANLYGTMVIDMDSHLDLDLAA